MNPFLKIILTILLSISSYSFADVCSTREVLNQHSANNSRVLEAYDRITQSWEDYANSQDEWDFEKLLTAVEYAARKHAGQIRKDNAKTPYIIHPIGVADLLWNVGNIRSVNVLTSALLHDTLEDTDATEQEIETLFGSRVLMTVKEVTNDPTLSSEANKERQILHAPQMSLDGQLVKLADRLYNIIDLRTPPPSWSQEKVKQYTQWGEKLLKTLKGTNEDLERALDNEIFSLTGVSIKD